MISIEFVAAECPDAGGLALLVPEGGVTHGRLGRGGCGVRRGDRARGGGRGVHRQEGAELHRAGAGRRAVAGGADRAGQAGRPYAARHGDRRRHRGGGVGAGGAGGAGGGWHARQPRGARGLGRARLRSYRFDRYRTKEAADAKPRLQALTVLTGDVPGAQAAWPAADAIAAATALTRDLVSERAERAVPRGDGGSVPALGGVGHRGRGAGIGGTGAARVRGADRRIAGQRARAAGGGDAVAWRWRRGAGVPGRQGRDVRHRRHQPEAGCRHGRHEVRHGRRGGGDRRDGGAGRTQGAGQCGGAGRAEREACRAAMRSGPAT